MKVTNLKAAPRGRLLEFAGLTFFDKPRHCSNPKCRRAFRRRALFVLWDWALDDHGRRLWTKVQLRFCSDVDGCASGSYLGRIVARLSRHKLFQRGAA